MTKEDFEHNHIKGIAEEYVQETWGSFLDLCPVDLVLAGIGVAKIISKEKDERIVELETQIEKMKNCGNCNGIIEGGLRAKKCKLCISSKDLPLWEIKEK